jgi:hypothetical protein
MYIKMKELGVFLALLKIELIFLLKIMPYQLFILILRKAINNIF